MSYAAAALTIQLTLAAVFLAAAVAKVTRRESTANALRGFGVPRQYVRQGAMALPAVELVVALLLLVPATAWVGAVAALGLLIMFSVALARVLVRGDAPSCRCFGALSRNRASWQTVGRNVVLAVPTAMLVSAGPGLEGGWLAGIGHVDTLAVVGVAFGVTLVLLVGVVWHLWRRQQWLLVRVDELDTAAGRKLFGDAVALGLPVGRPAPEFDLPGRDGERVALASLLASGRSLLLVFLESECPACEALAPTLQSWQIDVGDTEIVAITDDAEMPLEIPGLPHVLHQAGDAVFDAYRVDGTPAAVLIDPDGGIGAPLASGPSEIRRLIERLALGDPPAPDRDHPRRQAVTFGTPLTEFALPDLDGGVRTRSSLHGAETLLLFWNPNCGFCQDLLEDLRTCDREVAADRDARRLVVVSSGALRETGS